MDRGDAGVEGAVLIFSKGKPTDKTCKDAHTWAAQLGDELSAEEVTVWAAAKEVTVARRRVLSCILVG